MADWYYAEGTQRIGPVPEAELIRLARVGAVGPDTLVWTEGFADWRPAAGVAILFPNAPPAVRSGSRAVESHLAKAIITTILCCMPFGIVAIVYAAQVSTKLAQGDHAGAVESSRKADLWGNVSIGVALAFWALRLLVGAFD